MICLVFISLLWSASACSNILVSRGASTDNETHIAYNADSGNLYGSLGHYPAKQHKKGAMREVWDWDGSFYLGEIPEVAETYNVVGNVNEHGLIIGETTFGGLADLDGHDTANNTIDYGSLIWITLQRAKTAREAIATMDHLTQTYGYSSDGESFSIADGNEAWLMEMMSKGRHGKGSVWVASRIPEGYIGSHANQARTRTFSRTDPENVQFSADVVTFAQSIGLYPKDAKPEDFSFSDIYDPIVFGSARLGEARVWNIYELAAPGSMDDYLDYAQGYNLTNRMPLFIKPAKKLSALDVMTLMRSHGEGTWFDNTGTKRADVGAGSGHSSYRWRPLTWASGTGHYVNERTVGTQQTAWNFVASSRGWLPAPIRALMWWAPDDSATALRIPIYGGVTRIPAGFGDRVGQDPNAAVSYAVESDAFNMNMDSAFWVWNLVGNMAYGARGQLAYQRILREIEAMQPRLQAQAQNAEDIYLKEHKKDAKAALETLTKWTETTGQQTIVDWRNFWMTLVSATRDGFTTSASGNKQCVAGSKQYQGCTSRLDPVTKETGYDDAWYARVVADSDNAQHFHVPDDTDLSSSQHQWKLARMEKKRPSV